MIQQVNLYTDELRPRREPVQAPTLVWSTVAALVFLVIAAVVVRLEAGDAQARLQTLEARVAELEREATRLTAEVEAQQLDPALAQTLEETNQAIRQRQRLLDEVAKLVDHQGTGFSPYMAALARRVPDQLWLTGFSIDLTADQLELAGRTRSGSQVPVYLERLGQEPVFSGRRFGELRLVRAEAGPWVDFVIASGRDGGDS